MSTLTATSQIDANTLLRRADRRWKLAYSCGFLAALFVAAFALVSPNGGFSFAAAMYVFGIVAIMLRPVVGVYAITFLGLLADNVSSPSWPFLKNASSSESVLYVSDSAIISPMEGYLMVTVAAVITHITLRRLEYKRPPLIGPLTVFMVFIGVGLLWGIGRGGDVNIALWEARPFAALFVLYVLATTLLETRKQVHILSWVVVSAIFFESVRSVIWYLTTDDISTYDSIVEHSGATHMNLLFVMAILAWLVQGSGFGRRLLLPLMGAPVLWVYLISERRSAIAALIFGLGIVFVFLAATDARRFWQVGPLLLTIFVVYCGVFWNASGVLGFPAGVIKSTISPGSASAADQASDSYRVIEHLDILATIQRSPLLGVGFGQQYDRPLPLPDISFGFLWWEYITHNAIMWIWLKTGYFGFIAMFNFLGRALFLGMGTSVRAVDPADKVIAATAMIFIPVYMVYSYVDISWGTQSLILLAVSLATIAKIHDDLPEPA